MMIRPISMNQRAGSRYDKPCSTAGMLSMGNISPDSSTVGSISPISEIIIAICCVLDTVEMKMPRQSEVKI